MSAINTGLSGLLAAQTRLGTSANNISNVRSTIGEEDGVRGNKPYQPQVVAEQSLADGGVDAVVLDRQPASVPVYDPNGEFANKDGVVNYPNVELESEAVSQLQGRVAYQANLKSIQADEETTTSLLNILS